MKPAPRLRNLAMVSLLALSPLAFTACDDEYPYDPSGMPPGAGGYYQRGPGGLPPQHTWTQKEASTYERGFEAGRRDKALLRTDNYKRYSDDYASSLAEFYAAGYAGGYATAAGPTSDMNPTQRGVYDQGYAAGQRDYASGRSSNYRRYKGEYPNIAEPYFQLGYNDAFSGMRPR